MTALLANLREQAAQLSPAQFLAYHSGCFLQYYDDTPAKDPAKALSTSLFSATFAAQKQRDHCAVCFSLQAFTGSRTKERVSAFRNLGVDVDLAAADERRTLDVAAIDQLKEDYLQYRLGPFPLKPHWLIETQHGFHIIFRVQPRSEPEGIALGEAVNRDLVRALWGDDCAALLTQVLRVPGYRQFKDPPHPFLCRLLLHNADTIEEYPLEEVRRILAETSFPGEREQGDMTHSVQAGAAALPSKKWQAGLNGVAEGQRNQTAASLAGKIMAELPPELWDTGGWGGLREWNDKNRGPLSERELRSIYASIVRRERAKRQRKEPAGSTVAAVDGKPQAQAEKLVTLVRSGDTRLFHDQFGESYAYVQIGSGWRTCKIRGQEFREWIAQRLWDTQQRACSGEALHATLNTLAGMARHEGQRISLENRVAWHGSDLWYDLCDTQGRAVRVTAGHWEIVSRPPILFRRYSHQLPQVCPVRGRPLAALLPFINLANVRQQPLLLVYLVTCFLPDIPHPVAVFFGPQGAAKSTATRLLRRLIDPTAVEGLSFPDPRQLPQLLFHHWFAAFDNVSALSNEDSDLLCRAVTGDGFSRRRLYSDDEDLIYQFRRCICLNGISLVAEKPDLLSRCLMFALDHIPESSRREERDVLGAFAEQRAELLGAIFDALAGALQRHPSLPVLPLPRMADFARWGCAVADSLGFGREHFRTLYDENIREQRDAAIEASPVASAVTELMVRRQEWSGSATDLLSQLRKLVRDSGETGTGIGFPGRPNGLTKQLNVLRTVLAQAGIVVEIGYRTHGRRRIILRKANGTDTAASAADPQGPIPEASVSPSSPGPAPESWLSAAGSDAGADGGDDFPATGGKNAVHREALLHLPSTSPC